MPSSQKGTRAVVFGRTMNGTCRCSILTTSLHLKAPRGSTVRSTRIFGLTRKSCAFSFETRVYVCCCFLIPRAPAGRLLPRKPRSFSQPRAESGAPLPQSPGDGHQPAAEETLARGRERQLGHREGNAVSDVTGRRRHTGDTSADCCCCCCFYSITFSRVCGVSKSIAPENY